MFITLSSKLKQIRKLSIDLYTIAMMLSLASTLFGLLREVLVVKFLGFSTTNDYLQIYLSLYFSICLLSDPARLVYLNLINTRYFSQLIRNLLIIIAIISLILELCMTIMQPNLNLSLLSIAVVDGLLGTLASLIIFHKQRFGRYLSSQLVSVMPNLVLIPAVIIISFLPRDVYALNFLLAFLIIHIIQLTLLAFIKTESSKTSKQNMQWSDLLVCVRHFISILGEQFFQIAGRLLFLRLGEGFVTLLSLFIKCLLTARFVFVDSFIGPKLHQWNFGDPKDVVQKLICNHLLNITIMLPLLIICLANKVTILFMGLQLSLVFLGSFYFSSIYRIAYFKINRFIHYPGLVTFVGTFDLVFSISIYLFTQYFDQKTMIYIYLWYILRFPIELFVLNKYYYKAQNTLHEYS